MFGLIAYAIALSSSGINELVATASAFGSAGIFIVGMFGLFSPVGGPRSAYAALITGMLVWLVGTYVLDWSTPYVIALAASLGPSASSTDASARRTRPSTATFVPTERAMRRRLCADSQQVLRTPDCRWRTTRSTVA